MRIVVITGSEGHLGRALRAAFEALGDTVLGIDMPRTGAEIERDLDSAAPWGDIPSADIVICNAKTWEWTWHHALAMRARHCIINIASIYALLGSDPRMYDGTEVEPTPAWYAASKGALIALTRWQATNLAPVRSNAVCPGGILRGHSVEFRARYNEKVPLERMAREDDIVPLILFLASDDAAYITGQCIAVDGGLSVLA